MLHDLYCTCSSIFVLVTFVFKMRSFDLMWPHVWAGSCSVILIICNWLSWKLGSISFCHINIMFWYRNICGDRKWTWWTWLKFDFVYKSSDLLIKLISFSGWKFILFGLFQLELNSLLSVIIYEIGGRGLSFTKHFAKASYWWSYS